MKSKTSFFNKYIILEDLKRYWGVGVFYFLALFFEGPLKIIFLFSNPNSTPNRTIERFLNFKYADFQVMLSIGFPILLAMLIYRYLQQSKSTNVMHSFPVTRKELFNSHCIAGTLLLFFPVVVISIILMTILGANNDGGLFFKEIFTISSILKWAGITIITNTVGYFISSLVAMISGMTLIQGILSFIFMFLPIGLGTLMIINFDQIIYGFTVNRDGFDDLIMTIVPITTLMSDVTIDAGIILWYALLALTLYIVAYYFYKKRDLESASDPIAFDILKPIFKYGVTFCGMILGGAYFYGMEKNNLWLYIGYFIGAFLGYIIAEMIIKKSIWIFKNLKGFVIYSIAIIIIFTGIKLDLFGYEKRIPDLEDIESVYYGDSLYSYWKNEKSNLNNSENIKFVNRIHEEIIERKQEFIAREEDRDNRIIGIVYELKNGRKIVREYTVPSDYVEKNKSIAKLYESVEYKMNSYNIFDLDVSKISYIDINSELNHRDERLKIIEEKEIREMIKAIKADILSETYEEFMDERSGWADINIHYEKEEKQDSHDREKYDRVYAEWAKHDENLPRWLEENGYYERARVMPEDIDYIIIEEASEDIDPDNYDTVELEMQLKDNKNKKRMEIRDKDKIEDILVKYGRNWRDEKEYIVGFYFKEEDNNSINWVNGKNLPQFVIDYFK